MGLSPVMGDTHMADRSHQLLTISLPEPRGPNRTVVAISIIQAAPGQWHLITLLRCQHDSVLS